MRYLLMVLLTMSISAKEYLVSEHPIYFQILKNKPSIDRKFAMKLSNSIHRMTKKHNVPSRIYTAILMQESGYRLNIKRCINNFCSDFGMSQIYYKTAKSFGFDIKRLTTDLNYSIEAGVIVLADFKNRYYKREKYWWTRYNTSNKKKRNIYRKLVERYM